MTCRALVATAVLLLTPIAGAAQQARPADRATSRTTTAVTYEARRTTGIDLVGTPLLPRSRGQAEVETEASGPVRITAQVRDLPRATEIGREYLTYVLWAITPQGRPKNLGELRPDDGKAEIEATTDIQTFALVITAEPYYAVALPSDAVVLENAVRPDTRGRTSVATLQYEIVPRSTYAIRSGYTLPTPGRREPPDVQQARNAVAIAGADAERYSPESLATAKRLLAQTEQLVALRESSRDIVSQARATVQAAEEARLLGVTRRIAAERDAARAAVLASEQAARDQAAQEAAARQAAEIARLTAENDRRLAEQQAELAARERTQAEEFRRQADAARAEAQAQADRAEALRGQAERDQAELRMTLLRQLGDILETRDTTRGLIVNIGDVLFQVGRAELNPGAREKLARFAGIVAAHESLLVLVEGYTDSTGAATLNMRLSQERADAVRDFLLTQGLAGARVSSRGFGAADPIASNDTAAGRQQNRRVQLVVTGEVIGTPIGTSGR